MAELGDSYGLYQNKRHNMRAYVAAYNPYSVSARNLAQALGVRRLRLNGKSTYRPRSTDTIINWGSRAELPQVTVLNPPAKMETAQNKLLFFKAIHVAGVSCPPFTTSINDARVWVNDGKTVVARTVLGGHSGQGIVICNAKQNALPQAPLYTLYVPKTDEYRVHFVKDAHFVQRKARRSTTPDNEVNWQVRNLDGGFIYASDPENVGNVPACVIDEARKAFIVSGLDYGAVDVIFNSKKKTAYVLEMNTAPGLTGRTLDFYTKELKKCIATSATTSSRKTR